MLKYHLLMLRERIMRMLQTGLMHSGNCFRMEALQQKLFQMMQVFALLKLLALTR